MDESCRFLSGEPSVAWASLLGKGHFHETAVIAFGEMVIDRGTQVLKIAARATFVTAMPCVQTALLTVDFSKNFCAPPVIETTDPHLELADIWYRIFTRLIDLEAVA